MTAASSEETFHQSYDNACARAEGTGPVFAVMADALVVFRGREKHERRFALQGFHSIKTAAHLPLAAFGVSSSFAGKELDPPARAMLRGLVSAARIATEGVADPRAIADMRAATEIAIAHVEELLRAPLVSRETIDAFARREGPILLRLTEHATRIQLATLHAVVEDELSALSAEERSALQVVVAGDHQARVRSLAMQYFQKRFGESPGEERQIAYGEGIQRAEEALVLVGKRRADRALAAAFFGDATRLQRDVLGDAAAALLGDFPLAPIAPPRP
jgi:hypothetical protein